MNILVTGGAGYIGSLLVPYLLNKQHKVTVIDNFMYKQTSLSTSIENPNFKLIYGDVRDKNLMKNHLSKADLIIPLAAIVGAPACDKDYITAEFRKIKGFQLQNPNHRSRFLGRHTQHQSSLSTSQ